MSRPRQRPPLPDQLLAGDRARLALGRSCGRWIIVARKGARDRRSILVYIFIFCFLFYFLIVHCVYYIKAFCPFLPEEIARARQGALHLP